MKSDNGEFNAFDNFNDLDNCQGIMNFNNFEDNVTTGDKLENFSLLKNKKKEKKRKKKAKKISMSQPASADTDHLCLMDFPDVDNVDAETLKEECKKYGIKGGTLKNMQKSLKEIYQFISTKQLPEKLKESLMNFLEEDKHDTGSKVSKAALESFDDQKKKEVIEVIKKNKDLWKKILIFQKVELKSIKELLIKQKIIVSNDKLKNFLSHQGVLFPGGWN